MISRMTKLIELDDQRLVEADQAAAAVLAPALGRQGHGREDEEQRDDRAHEPPTPVGSTMMHEADSPGHVLLLKVCENYHAISGVCQSRPLDHAAAQRPPRP